MNLYSSPCRSRLTSSQMDAMSVLLAACCEMDIVVVCSLWIDDEVGAEGQEGNHDDGGSR